MVRVRKIALDEGKTSDSLFPQDSFELSKRWLQTGRPAATSFLYFEAH